MKAISVIVEHLNDTLKEANEYYRDYVIFKDDCPRLANTSLAMAKTHLDLYTQWHNVVVAIIQDYKDKNGEPPETMKKLWAYKHERFVEEYNELKYKINNI